MNPDGDLKSAYSFWVSQAESDIQDVCQKNIFPTCANKSGLEIMQYFYATMKSYLHIHFSLIYSELVHLALLQGKKCLNQSSGLAVTVLLGKVFVTAMPWLLHTAVDPPKPLTKGQGEEVIWASQQSFSCAGGMEANSNFPFLPLHKHAFIQHLW